MRSSTLGRVVFGAWAFGVVVCGACHPPGPVEEDGVPETFGEEPDRGTEPLPVPDFDPMSPRAGAPTDTLPPSWKPKGCSEIFGAELQTFELEVDPAVWGEIVYEYENFSRLDANGVELETYRPLLRFKHRDKSTTNAMIRLRGNTKWWDHQEKMQFQISFNETNEDGRFRGLRKIVLDSAHYNPSMLRDRLAMDLARGAGVEAPCVNHARLYVNGQFYGLYSHIEKVDREFLERNFEEPGGNLYKMSRLSPGVLKTNEDENPDTSRYDAFMEVEQLGELQALANLPQMVRVWATEALMPNRDGYWGGGWNFYLYDEPGKGFAYILWDLDLSFDPDPYDADPITWHKTSDNFNGRPHVELVLADPTLRWQFIREVRRVRDSVQLHELQSKLDTWAAQIRASVIEDPHAPWVLADHDRYVAKLRQHVEDRLRFLDDWLACWEAHDGDPAFSGPCPN